MTALVVIVLLALVGAGVYGVVSSRSYRRNQQTPPDLERFNRQPPS